MLAGLLSFLSPCVLPLVPPYLCFLGGLTMDQLAEQQAAGESMAARRVFFAALAFVLGFTTVFVALGATASAVGQVIAEYYESAGASIAGVIIIVLGLHFLGLLRIALLYREGALSRGEPPGGSGRRLCRGPRLRLRLDALRRADPGRDPFRRRHRGLGGRGHGLLLTRLRGLGIGLPFLAAALAAGPFMAFMARFRRHLGTVEKVMGGLLVLTGVLFLTGTMSEIAYWILEAFPALGRIG